MKNKRGLFIALILLLGVALTIGYAVLSQTLSIKGTTSIASNSWIIYFDHLMERPGTLTPTTPTTINDKKDRIDFSIMLDKPGDNYTFEVDIINDGTIDAMIDTVSLTGIPEELEGIIEWKVNYLTGEALRKCDELLANTKRRIKVVVNYNKDIDELPEEQELDLQLSVKYVQLDNSICTTTNPPSSPDPIDSDDGRHTLTIDPNYGIYEGTDAPTIVRMVPGEVYVFGANPIQEEHTFTGWTVEAAETYNETAGIITMDDEDINAIAGWNQNIDPITNQINCYRVGTSYFDNFNTALNSITEEGTIYLISNACTITERISIPEGKNITFDLNGHTITHNEMIYNDGNLTITDTSDRKSGKITANPNNNQYILNNPTIKEKDDINLHLLNANIRSNSELFVNNLRGNVYVDGGEYFVQREFVFHNGPGSSYIENSTIIIEETSGSSGELSALHIPGSNPLYAKFVNNEVRVKSKGTSVFIVYLNQTPETLEVHDIDVDVELLNSAHVWGVCDHSMGIKHDIEIDNFNLYVHGAGGSAYGLYINGDKKLTVKNSSFTYDYTTRGGEIYGMTYHSSGTTTLENVDLNVNLPNGGSSIYAMYGSDYTYNDGTINADVNGSIGYIYGLYCLRNCNINNVDIYIKANNEGGAVYGAYLSSNANYTQGSISVNTHNFGSVYGFYNSSNECVVDHVDITVDSHGDGEALYGIYSDNGTYKNSTMTVKNDGYKRGFKVVGWTNLENVNLKIVDNNNTNQTTLYGVVEAKGITSSNIEINIDGLDSVYGIDASSANITNTNVIINSKRETNVPKYGMSLYGTSTVTGGKLELKSPSIAQSSELDYLYGIKSSGTLGISNYNIISPYTCMKFTGDTLTTNNVTMTCGDYGIKKGDESEIDSTDTTINAGLE